METMENSPWGSLKHVCTCNL